MLRWHTLAALVLVVVMALAPSLADARAGGSYRGGGSSFTSQGSRGSRTYDQPMQRSITPQGQPASPLAQPGYGFGSAHPFMTGLAGGLFGGWLGSMLFPHWGMGMGGGFGGMFGSVFIWIILISLLWMGFRMLSRQFHPFAPPGAGAANFAGLGGAPSGGYAGTRGAPLAIVHADYEAFEAILKRVQAAWSAADLASMRQAVTPEILSYFAEELAENESLGVVNHVEQVELLRGDLREAWDEGRLQYATCYMQWRALDYTVRSEARPGDPGAVVNGDPRQPGDAAELWTFARSPGGHWLLSAIQQV
jgi:predicted lipid-binding transport protein (Tim44 family)